MKPQCSCASPRRLSATPWRHWPGSQRSPCCWSRSPAFKKPGKFHPRNPMLDWMAGMAGLLVLIFLGVPISFAMTLLGLLGVATTIGIAPAFAMLGQVFYDNGMNYTLSVMPLFVLMGNFVLKAGLADDMYEAANAWLQHYRGGLAMATIVACGGF